MEASQTYGNPLRGLLKWVQVSETHLEKERERERERKRTKKKEEQPKKKQTTKRPRNRNGERPSVRKLRGLSHFSRRRVADWPSRSRQQQQQQQHQQQQNRQNKRNATETRVRRRIFFFGPHLSLSLSVAPTHHGSLTLPFNGLFFFDDRDIVGGVPTMASKMAPSKLETFGHICTSNGQSSAFYWVLLGLIGKIPCN